MSVRLMRTLARCLLAAMLLAALAPAISRTLASTRVVGDWVEICTNEGMQWVQLTAEGVEAAPLSADDLQHALDDCGHCALAAERFAPLLPTLPVLPPAEGTWATPRYQAATQHDLAAPSPGARGPPLLS
ncbi:MAG: DUF2946 family protein [Hydrogenophaga sp.]|uniref:DUF2946 family protein n=1 Tax=Hydrogenophaga sp. TaxID=1904254 RepID=UPI00271F2CA7|nr:DUF2946 family protein [Hydrogenophaga sp.]MDO9132057.1 DUF2946 family protein [Hydrogenophaga sp.]MDP2408065.1 DUF2946 family protein [Hydrogenophaga sp.]MDP3325354.1 DUF2946 family protein [Hydrogenophaga sp.]MDZ4175919.1 DUF2946 family protein [Hydrogenophaga sp.]